MGDRPKNILFLWTDQQRPDTIGAYRGAGGDAGPATPALDRLATSSTLFERAYCSQPVCSPSRASVLTGLFPHSHGVFSNSILLPTSVPTLAELLRPAGYACGYIGKWHLGREHAAQRGFEDFWRSTENYPQGYPDGDPTAAAPSSYQQFLVDRGYAGATDPPISRPAAAALPEAAGKPAFQAAECVKFLDIYRDQPFLLMCNFLEPHPPVTGPFDGMYRSEDMTLPASWYREMEPSVPQRYRRRRNLQEAEEHYRNLRSDDEWGWKNIKARYWGLCTLVDKYVGRILDHLEALGLAEDTVVVYSSDHGDMMGEHRLLNKGVQFESSVRVPLLIRVPGAAPRRVRGPVSQVQLVPTLLELLNQPAPAAAQSTSLAGLFASDSSSNIEREVTNDVFVEWNGYDGFPRAYRARAQAPAALDPALRWQEPDVRTILSGRWKLNLHVSGEHELYDLEADPSESHNAIVDSGNEPVVTDLAERLQQWQRQTNDTLALPALE